MQFPIRGQFTALTAVLLLAGCASTNNIEPQSSLINSQQLQLSTSTNIAKAVSINWWTAANDAQLNALMADALKNAPTLKQAAARVREAENAVGMANSANGPNLDLTASSRRDRFSKNTIQPLAPNMPNPQPLYETTNNLGLNFSYEFDWWGKYRNQVNAAKAQVNAAQAEQQQTTLSLTSAIASAYYQLQSNYAMQELLNKQIQSYQALAEINQQQYNAGVVGIEVWQQSQAQVDINRQMVTQIQTQIDLLSHQIAALTGKSAAGKSAIQRVSLPDSQWLTPPTELTINLLGQRPDITAQRELVESYEQSVQAARKDFYPSVSISGFAGFTTANFKGTNPTLLEAASKAWNLAPAISLPIFHAGALQSKLGEESALYDQAVESYNQTILNAVQDAADAITQQQSASQMYQQAQGASQSTEQVYRVAQAQYQSGLTGRLPMLNSETQLLQQQQAELNAKNNLLQSKIGLIRSLGGGYQAPVVNSKA
ncbi:efflux transporter outer membrane subunit [Hafnia paralvei]|jgi:NodT family efflux transporter outer membrane factor (OMF) lipoprotein|uniref:efflux transporter outer membrane subunit n=1 Tax=Hafnia paralvei TaxID=546367 RepID=UPI0015851C91|nr:efflux transporter outer membrane subunit [Hafnia paralvei]MCE9881147.1 efflux transporter outer membrane subunit [Hafnia paralvei]MCE9906356.1 efflux transporter outer membrane subunit [Hafnia paralvei]MCE9912143.1 efflux transporter outer membrane subunit [Hafnia paralvei]NUN43431.1 efflux transporter outer membrane subunit [Hafnia paralvei]